MGKREEKKWRWRNAGKKGKFEKKQRGKKKKEKEEKVGGEKRKS